MNARITSLDIEPTRKQNSYVRSDSTDTYLEAQNNVTLDKNVGHGLDNDGATVSDTYLTTTIAEVHPSLPRKLPDPPPEIYDRIDEGVLARPRASRRKLWCIVGLLLALCLCAVVAGVLAWHFTSTAGRTEGTLSYTGSRVAFSAYSPTNDGHAESPRAVMFSKTWTKYGTSYRNSTFTSPARDLYFNSLAAINNGSGGVNISLQGAPYSVGNSRTSTTHNTYDSLQRTALLELNAKDQLQVTFTGHLTCCFSTSWSLFSLSGAMKPLVVFSVVNTRPYSAAGAISFHQTLVNIGDWKIEDSHTFIAPVPGTYYFSASAGLQEGESANVHLMKNRQRVFGMLRSSTDHDGTDSISSSTLISLKAGDKIHLELVGGALHSSQEFRETSLLGFLVQTGQNSQVAWSVRRTTPFIGNFTGSFQPVPFDVILVNENGVFKTGDNWAVVPTSGVYYVEVTAGVGPGQSVRLFVCYGPSFQERVQTATLSRETSGTGYDTVTAGAVVSLDQGHRVWVAANDLPGWGFYSDLDLITSFTGFLVY